MRALLVPSILIVTFVAACAASTPPPDAAVSSVPSASVEAPKDAAVAPEASASTSIATAPVEDAGAPDTAKPKKKPKNPKLPPAPEGLGITPEDDGRCYVVEHMGCPTPAPCNAPYRRTEVQCP